MSDTDLPRDIDGPDLAAWVEGLTYNEIDQLPFGAVRLDGQNRVVLLSAVEREQTGFRLEAGGRNFFTDIAPCFNRPVFKDKVETARKTGRLDASFDIVSDLPGGQRDVDIHVRMMSATGGGCWIFSQTLE